MAEQTGREQPPKEQAGARTLTLCIGGGPAGLTAAYLLTREGYPVTVLEPDTGSLGGISRTVAYKGYLCDIGGHRFFSKSAEVNRLWEEILDEGFIERPRKSRILYRGNCSTIRSRRATRCASSACWSRRSASCRT